MSIAEKEKELKEAFDQFLAGLISQNEFLVRFALYGMACEAQEADKRLVDMGYPTDDLSKEFRGEQT